MRNLFVFLTIIAWMAVSPWAHAVEMQSIYQTTVAVASQSDEDRAPALQKGLQQVLVEVSGNSHILDNAKLKTSLAHAEDMVQEFSYSTPPTAPKTTPYLLQMRFDQEEINRLLRDAGAAMWGQSRPLILVWLVYESPDHPADIVDNSASALQTLFINNAKQRGLPFIFPMMDAEELSQISVENILNKNMATLKQASQRYASNGILIGHIKQEQGGTTSQWQLVLAPDQWDWNITAKDPATIFSQLVNTISDTLAERYSAIVSNGVQAHITLQVIGLKQQDDLSQLIKYLQHLTPVAQVQLRNVAGDEIVLDVNLRSSQQSFIQAAALGTVLVPVFGGGMPQDGTLQYKWNP